MEVENKADISFTNATLSSRPPDIVVCVDMFRFHVHKDVLMECSDYFKAMFSSRMLEYTQDTITIKLIEKYPFEILIKGFYSGQLLLTAENVFEVTRSAHILQVADELFKECCDFIISLISPQKCFEILHFSQFHNLQAVYNASRRFCVSHFGSLCKEESFLNLSLDQVVGYLSDEFLVVDGDFGKVLAFTEWCKFNDISEPGVLQKSLCKFLHCTDVSLHSCREIALRLSKKENFDEHFLPCLDTTILNQSMMMFWARLSDSEGEGLVDVVKVCDSTDGDPDAGKAVKVDTMTCVVEKPGFDLGSAVCAKGLYVYLCGGGPNFGRMDWIRDIWRYSILKDGQRWETIGKLPHPLRYHAIIPVGTKLYVFGGFGKFRSKNCQLESFDLVTGAWRQHASAPTWEIKPVATYHYQTIYYITREWNIYAYDTVSDMWTGLDPSSPSHDDSFHPSETFDPNGAHLSKPLSCFVRPFPFKERSRSVKFIVLSQGHQQLRSHSFSICLKSKSFHPLKPECKHNMNSKTRTFLGSCVLGKRMFAFFKTVTAEEMDAGGDMDLESGNRKETECTSICAVCLSLETGLLSEGFQLNNVVKMQSVLAVPYVPETFLISNQSSSITDGYLVPGS